MFGKKFFSTVALSGTAVGLVGNVGSVFAEEIGPHDSNIVLTCKDDTVDYEADNDENSYYYVNNESNSWSLQDLVDFLRLDRSETEKFLYRVGHCPGWYCRFVAAPGLALAQIAVDDYTSGLDSIWVEKRAKHEYFGSWVYRVTFDKNCVDNMLKTDLDTIDFSHSRPKKTEPKKTEPKKTEPKKTKERPWRMYY